MIINDGGGSDSGQPRYITKKWALNEAPKDRIFIYDGKVYKLQPSMGNSGIEGYFVTIPNPKYVASLDVDKDNVSGTAADKAAALAKAETTRENNRAASQAAVAAAAAKSAKAAVASNKNIDQEADKLIAKIKGVVSSDGTVQKKNEAAYLSYKSKLKSLLGGVKDTGDLGTKITDEKVYKKITSAINTNRKIVTPASSGGSSSNGSAGSQGGTGATAKPKAKEGTGGSTAGSGAGSGSSSAATQSNSGASKSKTKENKGAAGGAETGSGTSSGGAVSGSASTANLQTPKVANAAIANKLDNDDKTQVYVLGRFEKAFAADGANQYNKAIDAMVAAKPSDIKIIGNRANGDFKVQVKGADGKWTGATEVVTAQLANYINFGAATPEAKADALVRLNSDGSAVERHILARFNKAFGDANGQNMMYAATDAALKANTPGNETVKEFGTRGQTGYFVAVKDEKGNWTSRGDKVIAVLQKQVPAGSQAGQTKVLVNSSGSGLGTTIIKDYNAAYGDPKIAEKAFYASIDAMKKDKPDSVREFGTRGTAGYYVEVKTKDGWVGSTNKVTDVLAKYAPTKEKAAKLAGIGSAIDPAPIAAALTPGQQAEKTSFAAIAGSDVDLTKAAEKSKSILAAIDMDSNGKISNAEASLLKGADYSGNNKVSLAEATKFINAADTDKSGVLSTAESNAYFAMLDANKDGKISKKERKNMVTPASISAGGAEGNAANIVKPTPAKTPTDTDKDGIYDKYDIWDNTKGVPKSVLESKTKLLNRAEKLRKMIGTVEAKNDPNLAAQVNFLKKDLAAVETGLGIPNDGTNPVTLTPATPSAPAASPASTAPAPATLTAPPANNPAAPAVKPLNDKDKDGLIDQYDSRNSWDDSKGIQGSINTRSELKEYKAEIDKKLAKANGYLAQGDTRVQATVNILKANSDAAAQKIAEIDARKAGRAQPTNGSANSGAGIGTGGAATGAVAPAAPATPKPLPDTDGDGIIDQYDDWKGAGFSPKINTKTELKDYGKALDKKITKANGYLAKGDTRVQSTVSGLTANRATVNQKLAELEAQKLQSQIANHKPASANAAAYLNNSATGGSIGGGEAASALVTAPKLKKSALKEDKPKKKKK